MEEETKQDHETQQSSNKTYIAIVGLVVILSVAGFIYESKMQQKSKAEKKITMLSPTHAKTAFKDGIYSAEGDYVTHVGPKHIKVTITLKSNIITDADVKSEADDPMSVQYQDSFISGYKQYVVGKDITTVHLTKVARSSLTPNGFNSALKLIEDQAKS